MVGRHTKHHEKFPGVGGGGMIVSLTKSIMPTQFESSDWNHEPTFCRIFTQKWGHRLNKQHSETTNQRLRFIMTCMMATSYGVWIWSLGILHIFSNAAQEVCRGKPTIFFGWVCWGSQMRGEIYGFKPLYWESCCFLLRALLNNFSLLDHV